MSIPGWFSKLNDPYPCYPTRRKNVVVTFSFSLFIFAFLYYFRPFGLASMDSQKLLFVSSALGIICFLVVAVNLSVFMPKFTEAKSGWTLGRQVFLIVWNMATVYAAYIIFLEFTGLVNFDAVRLMKFTVYMASAALFPITILILTDYLAAYKQKANEFSDSDPSESRNGLSKKLLTFSSDNEKEQLHLYLDELLYITSESNYVEIFYLANEKVKRALFRGTLQKIESELKNLPVVRCHRSFLVNLYKVMKAEGDAHGYQLHLRGIAEKIPVSRSYVKPVLKAIKETKEKNS